MNVYVSNILFAALSFPLIAFFITLPYMIYQYRRFGSIPWLRTLVVYSFAFYLLCAYFLVLLPLPEDRSAVVPYAQTPQLVPFNFVHGFLAETTFSPSDPSTWLAALRDPYVYEAFFNVLLLVPLGMYLRYYFRRTWWQTLAIGFLVTLSFETTQLTGLWGLYEHPYRLFDVDDLMLNTLGAMIGFWTVGPAMRVLPDIRLVNEDARCRSSSIWRSPWLRPGRRRPQPKRWALAQPSRPPARAGARRCRPRTRYRSQRSSRWLPHSPAGRRWRRSC